MKFTAGYFNTSSSDYTDGVLKVNSDYVIDQKSIVISIGQIGSYTAMLNPNIVWDADGKGFTLNIGSLPRTGNNSVAVTFFVKTASINDKPTLNSVLTALDPSGAATSVNGTAHGKYVPTSNGSFTPNITASDKTIYSTQKLSESDLLALATAKDQTDGDISKNITITDKGGFKLDDTNAAGTYTIAYAVTNSSGNTSTATSTITVKADQTSTKAKDSTLVAGPDTKWNAADNFVSATDADGNGIDFKSVNVSGSVDPTQPGKYEVTYSYTDAGGNQVSAKATITVVSTKASIKAKDSTLVAGPDTKWNATDNFVSATDADGNGIDFKNVNVSGSVDPTKPGKYEVTYSYTDAGGNQVSAKATITVVSSKANINGHDSTIDQGDSWTPQNNFDGGTDAEGNVIDFREIVVEA